MRYLVILAAVAWTLAGCARPVPTVGESQPGPAARHRNVEPLVDRAVELGLRGKLDKAIALLDEALGIDPRHATALSARATAHRKLGNYRQAVEDSSKAIEIDPALAAAYWQRAFSLQQGELDNWVEKSFADANQAIELDPSTPLPFILRGNAFFERKEYSKSLADYSKAIELNPGSYMAHAGRARTYYTLRDVAKAREEIDKALSLNPPAEEETKLRAFRKSLDKQS
jgi:tetratricopeptide (TPR) repeat protein